MVTVYTWRLVAVACGTTAFAVTLIDEGLMAALSLVASLATFASVVGFAAACGTLCYRGMLETQKEEERR